MHVDVGALGERVAGDVYVSVDIADADYLGHVLRQLGVLDDV